MAVDYDLVVVGSSPEGIYAAASATYLQARVALVTQSECDYLDNNLVIEHSISEVGRWLYWQQKKPLAIAFDAAPPASLTEAIDLGQIVNSNVRAEDSLESLAALGVDVIFGKGEFCRLPKLGFNVGKRHLRSRKYLLATGSRLALSPAYDIAQTNYLTLDALWQRALTTLPQSIAIVGGSLRSLEIAQILARFGKSITLILEHRLLPREEPETSRLIQAQLEAEGIEIIIAPVTQIKLIAGTQWLQVGNKAVETDAIFFGDRFTPNIEGLNLAGVEVKYERDRLIVNSKLQTTNPHIYACGDLLGGYSLPNIARYEVNIALKNALFLPRFHADYRCIPWAIFTQPNVARVGMTEAQAKKEHKNVYVVKLDLKGLVQAQILGETTGLCKLLVSKNGEILGCTLIGDRAAELIGAIALAMQQKIKLNRFAITGFLQVSFPAVYLSFAQIWQQAARAYYLQKMSKNRMLLNLLETWFDFRKK
ncbi:NAD(P)/FAD-dependent oxidoreductase [Myxosarcina sp. GI1]|uniref:dihydrolipoyl dehydrogenase family protein n=1 Tax=Myxosarcina sp. GI1 TaxID=1541065 RepID=UPI000568592B|nr:NAD(P)/FAD-dependent oxidoreductase [Myxosarcina sp. GI1]